MLDPTFNEPVVLGEWTLPSGRKAFAWLEPNGTTVTVGVEEPGPVDQDVSDEDLEYLRTIVHSEAQRRAAMYLKGAC